MTPAALLPFCNLLPDTKSAKCRGYKFTRSADVAGGTLTYQAKGTVANYWMEAFPADLAGSAFRFVKVVKAGEEQAVHETLLADRPQDDQCDCQGFQRYASCRHLDVLRDLRDNGQLPALTETDADALCDPDADCGATEFEDVYAGVDAWVASGERAFATLSPAEYARWLAAPHLIDA